MCIGYPPPLKKCSKRPVSIFPDGQATMGYFKMKICGKTESIFIIQVEAY